MASDQEKQAQQNYFCLCASYEHKFQQGRTSEWTLRENSPEPKRRIIRQRNILVKTHGKHRSIGSIASVHQQITVHIDGKTLLIGGIIESQFLGRLEIWFIVRKSEVRSQRRKFIRRICRQRIILLFKVFGDRGKDPSCKRASLRHVRIFVSLAGVYQCV